MDSCCVHAPWPFRAGAPLPLPMVQGTVRAGFPSPADDFAVKRHDLNDLLITHPAATFFWRVRGTSMHGAGISDGDILIVNRALDAKHGDKLVAADPTFPDIVFREGQTMAICGVVTGAIKRFR
jgi:DNA polymerase V